MWARIRVPIRCEKPMVLASRRPYSSFIAVLKYVRELLEGP